MTFASFRASPLARGLGAALSWFLFSAGLVTLVLSMFDVLAIGGSCASGGAYDISVECPDSAALAPLGIFAGLGGAAIAFVFSQGFGTSLIDLAWPLLFGILGAIFISSLDVVGLVIGGLFEIMAIVPLIIVVRASPQRVFLGAVNLGGKRFYEGDKARRSPLGLNFPAGEYPIMPGITNWLASAVFLLLPVAAGWMAAMGLYAAVS
jgi:hypothetical protein